MCLVIKWLALTLVLVREAPEPKFSEDYSRSPRLRPLHQGLVGRQSIIYTSLSLFLSVLFGLAFGLGHHFFYRHLDGKPVSVDSDGGLSVLDQQWVAQIGVAFVFLTKTCFAAAISTAFVQRAWMTVSQKPLPLSGIDSLWSILGYVKHPSPKLRLLILSTSKQSCSLHFSRHAHSCQDCDNPCPGCVASALSDYTNHRLSPDCHPNLRSTA